MKKKILFIILGITVMVIGLVGFNSINSSVTAKDSKPEEHVRNIGATFMANFDNKQILAGSADYLFTGEVTEKLGEVDDFDYPTTQFKVEVSNQLQGKLPSKEVTINQYGGHHTEEVDGETIEILYLFEGDPLLETGNQYVFAANKQEDGSILLIPLYGNTKVEENSINGGNGIIQEFEEAVKNPIVPELQQRINESKE
ncbi:hypothetical protein [Oceanobacillus kapialis]|uniref:hypothetical protein n=1 Tax=Oceanobacillus kapialis TaxID=481353 RepID=UPI00384E60A1